MSESTPDCLFCKIVGGEIPAETVYDDAEILAFKDINPQTPFHCLVIPKTHIATLNDFEEGQGALIARLMLVARQIAAQESLAGYRVAMNVEKAGGQVIFHAHLHVLGGRPLSPKLG
jgi:histidine triad (HIT) family protein